MVLCFFFCGVPGILFASYQSMKGRTRRAREAWWSVVLGWLARGGLFLLANFSGA